jgi:hypothetical protein
MNYSYVLLSEQDGTFSNNASLLGWPTFVATSWNDTRHMADGRVTLPGQRRPTCGARLSSR